MLNLDDHVEMSKTEFQMANMPWKGKISVETDLGDKHLIPLTETESAEMIRTGEIDCNEHIEEPGCFCDPFLSVSNERLWIHRKVGK
jgi:hypothetical protein